MRAANFTAYRAVIRCQAPAPQFQPLLRPSGFTASSKVSEMNPVALSDDWSLTGLEDSLARIAASEGAPLKLNRDFVGSRRGALHDAARLQVLATWARRAIERKVFYHSANLPTAVVEELCDFAPGIALLRLSDEVVIGDKAVRRRDALEPAADKMAWSDQALWTRIIKGRTIDFTSVSGSKVQYLRPLFTVRNTRAVKRKEGMFLTLQSLAGAVAKDDAGAIPAHFLQACAIFASELLKNTQEHATSDFDYQEYVAHVEGLIVSWQEMTSTAYKADFQGHPRLTEFWRREEVSVRGGDDTALRCLQLSFFDTGPGFASRFARKPASELSLDDERKALMSALERNASTKRETGSGNGFPEVLAALRDVGGLISVRSGKLHVFNAFVPGDDRDLFDFSDWTTKPLAEVEGAVVSVLLPIRR
jgi:hypothetical protein